MIEPSPHPNRAAIAKRVVGDAVRANVRPSAGFDFTGGAPGTARRSAACRVNADFCRPVRKLERNPHSHYWTDFGCAPAASSCCVANPGARQRPTRLVAAKIDEIVSENAANDNVLATWRLGLE